MSDPLNPSKTFSFSTFFSKGQYETLSETLEVGESARSITIGMPKEHNMNERRTPLVPHSIRTLVGHGHRVIVETSAGEKSHFSDLDFSEAGADMSYDKEKVFKSQIVLKAAPPTLEELDLMEMNQVLISPLHIPIVSSEYLQKLKKKKIIALAMEYLKSTDGSFPIVRIMSEIAGLSAVLTAADLLNNTKGGRGVLLGGISGVPPAKVVILGGGVVGEFAARAALGMGASVRIFDNDIYKLMRLQTNIGRQLHTSSFNPVYLAYQLTSADVVIGAIHSKTGRSPIIVTEDMVSKMKPGAVIIDVSIDQGGCIETSEMRTHDSPTFMKHDIIHYCVPNIASKISRTASVAISNVLTPLLLQAGNSKNLEAYIYDNHGIRNGVYTYKGCLTNHYLSKRFNMKYTDIDLLLTSGL